jgi:hypothetical protein
MDFTDFDRERLDYDSKTIHNWVQKFFEHGSGSETDGILEITEMCFRGGLVSFSIHKQIIDNKVTIIVVDDDTKAILFGDTISAFKDFLLEKINNSSIFDLCMQTQHGRSYVLNEQNMWIGSNVRRILDGFTAINKQELIELPRKIAYLTKFVKNQQALNSLELISQFVQNNIQFVMYDDNTSYQ